MNRHSVPALDTIDKSDDEVVDLRAGAQQEPTVQRAERDFDWIPKASEWESAGRVRPK